MSIYHAFANALSLLQNFMTNQKNLELVQKISDEISETFSNQNKVLICGNGGSATDAMHFAEEFTGKFRSERKALPAIALTDPSHITCVGNDYGFSEIFARGVEAFGKKNDFFIGLSTSGNSENIIKAFQNAQKQGLKTFLLLGKDGGKLKDKADYEIIIPGKTSDRIQEMHMMILHIVIEYVERNLFPENYKD